LRVCGVVYVISLFLTRTRFRISRRETGTSQTTNQNAFQRVPGVVPFIHSGRSGPLGRWHPLTVNFVSVPSLFLLNVSPLPLVIFQTKRNADVALQFPSALLTLHFVHQGCTGDHATIVGGLMYS
jgi:hypothetical protein